MGVGFSASALQWRANSLSRVLRQLVRTAGFRPLIRQIVPRVLQLVALVAPAASADAQTAQLIVTGPASLAGSYAAVTYDKAPSNVTSTTPIPQGNIFIYDGVDCATHTFTKPVPGSGAGKVAMVTGIFPLACTYYDDIVRELQADGVVAVVFGLDNGGWRAAIGHGNTTGLTVPVVYMQVDEVSQSIRSAVLSGKPVSVSFVAVPGMAMIVNQYLIFAGQSNPLGLVPHGSPSTGAMWDLSTLDLDRYNAGIQHDFATKGTGDLCSGVSFHWDPAMHLLSASVPTTNSYVGFCPGLVYLIRDTAGFQGAGVVRVNIGDVTGWWWNASEAGRGFFIERKGATIVMAGYIYDDAGNATWFLAAGSVSGNVFTAEMQTYRNGQTLIGTHMGPVAGPSLGTITVRFTSVGQATISWPGGTFPIIRYAYAPGGPGVPGNGWWWSKSESGRGFSIEIQGNTLAMAGYMYAAAGAPVWYLTAGAMTTPTTYTGSLQQYGVGQSIGGLYHPPQIVDPNVGAVKLVFVDAENGTLTLPDGRDVGITRFAF